MVEKVKKRKIVLIDSKRDVNTTTVCDLEYTNGNNTKYSTKCTKEKKNILVL